MKPAPFDFAAPTTVVEALHLLAQAGEDAKVLAGGQSLIPLLNFRLLRPRLVVDLNRIDALAGIRPEGEGLAIGSMTRQADAEASPLVLARAPLLAEALSLIGHPAIRFRGTVGGSLAHADPAAELPAVAIALDAVLGLAGTRGGRTVKAADFFLGPMTTDLAPGEILSEIVLPPWSPAWGWACMEFARRAGDFALAGAVVALAVDNGRIAEPTRVVVIGGADRCHRASATEASLLGRTPDTRAFGEAAALADAGIDVRSDVHGSAAYRRDLMRTLTSRALATAAARAGGHATHG
ncbi:MAG: xanthine dehydrogenase family protein subunit M [Candidatus Rokubacteria bacterium]|nr:xanthine dehydrogenase family protein subunit M [Candidatus Rokubacteria bacterium]MBI3108951.1 xanthine dehydrogenase family protein subunit M [Candidatus Rokubacteria bacterium]